MYKHVMLKERNMSIERPKQHFFFAVLCLIVQFKPGLLKYSHIYIAKAATTTTTTKAITAATAAAAVAINGGNSVKTSYFCLLPALFFTIFVVVSSFARWARKTVKIYSHHIYVNNLKWNVHQAKMLFAFMSLMCDCATSEMCVCVRLFCVCDSKEFLLLGAFSLCIVYSAFTTINIISAFCSLEKIQFALIFFSLSLPLSSALCPRHFHQCM